MILNISLLWEQGVHIRKGLKKKFEKKICFYKVYLKKQMTYAYAKRNLFLCYICNIYMREKNKILLLYSSNIYGPHDNFHPINSHVIPGLIKKDL